MRHGVDNQREVTNNLLLSKRGGMHVTTEVNIEGPANKY